MVGQMVVVEEERFLEVVEEEHCWRIVEGELRDQVQSSLLQVLVVRPLLVVDHNHHP